METYIYIHQRHVKNATTSPFIMVPSWVLSTYPWTNTQTRSYNGMYAAIRMNQDYNNVDEPHKQNSQWKKSDPPQKKCILYDSMHVKAQKQTKSIYCVRNLNSGYPYRIMTLQGVRELLGVLVTFCSLIRWQGGVPYVKVRLTDNCDLYTFWFN